MTSKSMRTRLTMHFSPSGTHALAYARAVSLDIKPLSDAIFRADTGVGVERLCRAFPAEKHAWRVHAEGQLCQTFEWEMTHVPMTPRIDYNTRVTHRSSWRRLDDTGEPTQTVRERISTDTFCRNLGTYNWSWVNSGFCHEQSMWIVKLTLGMAMRVDFVELYYRGH